MEKFVLGGCYGWVAGLEYAIGLANSEAIGQHKHRLGLGRYLFVIKSVIKTLSKYWQERVRVMVIYDGERKSLTYPNKETQCPTAT